MNEKILISNEHLRVSSFRINVPVVTLYMCQQRYPLEFPISATTELSNLLLQHKRHIEKILLLLPHSRNKAPKIIM